ncbi:MAG: hypothetical protein ACLFSR_03565 [Halomonas sp.]
MENIACRRWGGIALAMLLLLPVASHGQDGVVEQIEAGLDLYQQEDYGGAITELQFAIEDIRELVASRIAETFPEPPAGWSAEEVQGGGSGAAAAMFGGAGGTALTRRYSEDAGDGRLEASMMVDNPMVQAMSAMFNNPAMISAQPNMDRVRIGSERGILEWEPDRGQAELSLLLDGRILLQVQGENLESEDAALALMEAWDLDAVRAQTAR